MAKKNRANLYNIFRTGSKPTQEDFEDFVDSTLNLKEDGVITSGAGNPIQLNEQWGNAKLLNFGSFEGDVLWTIAGKSTQDIAGLSFNALNQDELFINRDNAFVGISTGNPAAKLHVKSSAGNAFVVDDQNDQTLMMISNQGHIGIGENSDTQVTLNVGGDTKVNGHLIVSDDLKLQTGFYIGSQGINVRHISNNATLNENTETLLTEAAVKTYVDTEVDQLDINLTQQHNTDHQALQVKLSDLRTDTDNALLLKADKTTLNQKIDNVEQQISDEANARVNAVNVLDSKTQNALALKADTTTVDNQVQGLEQQITDEVASRQGAVDTLDTKTQDALALKVNTTTVANQVQGLVQQISDEASARQNAVDALDTKIQDALALKADSTTVGTQVQGLEQQISDETTARLNVVGALDTKTQDALALKAETTAVDNQMLALEQQINTETAQRGAGLADLKTEVEGLLTLKSDKTELTQQLDAVNQTINTEIGRLASLIAALDERIKILE